MTKLTLVDPGIQQCTLTKLSDRLQGIKDRWLNLGDNQRAILDNIIISAEWLEQRFAQVRNEALEEAAVLCDDSGDSGAWSDDFSTLARAEDARAKSLAKSIRSIKQQLPQKDSGE